MNPVTTSPAAPAAAQNSPSATPASSSAPTSFQSSATSAVAKPVNPVGSAPVANASFKSQKPKIKAQFGKKL